jgi:hypothetical protein
MSANTLPLASCWHDTLKALGTSMRYDTCTCTLGMIWFYVLFRLHAERQGNGCPCYPMLQFVKDQLPLFYHWFVWLLGYARYVYSSVICRLSLLDTQCHGSSLAITGERLPYDDSALNMFDTTTGIVGTPFELDADLSCLSTPFPMESEFIHQPLPNTALDADNGMDAAYLSVPDQLEDYKFNPEPFPEFQDSFPPELSMSPSMDLSSFQMWGPHTLPQSPDTQLPDAQSPDTSWSDGSSGSSSFDYQWTNDHVHDSFIEPSSYNIQPPVQNTSDFDPPSFCIGTDLHSPTPSWSEEKRGEWDDTDGTSSLCRWGGGSCTSPLTPDKSEVGKHLQVHHGVKSGGDKDRMPCSWDGCGKEMKKESISRHIVAVHLSDKTECSSCGKQFARSDSKLRHLKNSKREECRESEPQAKRRRLSWP